MQIIRILFLITMIISIGSCKKDEAGSLTLHFLASMDGTPLEMFKPYSFIESNDIQFTHLSMLVSDLKLLTPTGSQFLKDVELVDLSFDDITAASGGYSVHIGNIPADTYSGITFGIGVPHDINTKNPSDFASGNPLSKTSYFWLAWESYIFMKTEGRIDTDLPGDFETSFAYHTGTDDLYTILVLESGFPLTIIDGQDTELSIVFDYGKILEGIDIEANPQNHNPEDTVQINKIVNNLQSSITLFQ